MKQTAQLTTDFATVLLAKELAEYGYQQHSAESLIVAAQMLLENPAGVLTPEQDQTVKPLASTTSDVEFPAILDPAQLLAEARQMAAENAVVQALAQRVENRLGEKPRQLLDGRKSIVSVLAPHGAYAFKGAFIGGKVTEVMVIGNGATNLRKVWFQVLEPTERFLNFIFRLLFVLFFNKDFFSTFFS